MVVAEARLENRTTEKILRCCQCNNAVSRLIGDCCNIRCWSLRWNHPYGTTEYEQYRKIFSGEEEQEELLKEIEKNTSKMSTVPMQQEEKSPNPMKPGVDYFINRTTPEGVPLCDLQDLNYIVESLQSGTDHQKIIAKEGLAAVALLLRKNKDYGSSAYDSPLLVPHLPAKTAILVRMSDKIKRFQQLMKSEREVNESIEDTMFDLLGYSLLYLTCPEQPE